MDKENKTRRDTTDAPRVLMNDNYFISDLLSALREDAAPERYRPLMPMRKELDEFFRQEKAVFRDDVTEDIHRALAGRYGESAARLLRRYLHIYDFNPAKLREISDLEGADYDAAADLLRLPGVRRLRADLYRCSGVTLKLLADNTPESIQDAVRAYVTREGRSETVPFIKEINCHRAAARMILHLRQQEQS